MKKQLSLDYTLLIIVLLLLAYGLIVLYSASSVQSFKNFGNTTYYITHQLLYGAIVGLIAMAVLSKVDYHVWQKYLPWLIFISLFLLALVKIPHFGRTFGGASRWLDIGGILFQPAELSKFAIIVYIASWVDKKKQHLNDFYFGLLPSLVIIGLFALLILVQPDFGTMLVLLILAFSMLVVAGIEWKYFIYGGVLGSLGLYFLILTESYRLKRLTAFLNPSADPGGISYQINQALLAIGSGGWWGYGYGLSRQKHSYLPEVMTDSIFAVLAEELGFIRIMILFALFLLFALKGVQIARRAPDIFGKMMAFGLTAWIVIQASINIGAMLKILPLTGIPLPFFSYGSTALIMNLAAMGVLLNISRYAK